MHTATSNARFSRRSSRVTALILLLVAVIVGSSLAPLGTAAQSGNTYWAEWSGHTIGSPFTQAWKRRGGWARYGLPVSEKTRIRGKDGQFFEYGAIIVDGDLVLEEPVGRQALTLRVDPTRTYSGRRVGSPRPASPFARGEKPEDADALYDAETGHSVEGEMLDFYRLYDGQKWLGEPISGEYNQGQYRVQWFERGRIQKSLIDGKISRAAVGAEVAHLRGVSTVPVPRGNKPLLDPDRFVTYKGDGTIPEASGRFDPARIMIPDIGIDAAIERVAIENKQMGTPADPWNVGWYPTLSFPGDRTNVVMAGHRDWWGVGPTVFWDLPNLWVGAKIYLTDANGDGATYVITEVYPVSASNDAGKIIGDTGREIITLITCSGTFDGSAYTERTIVHAERI